LSLAETEVLTPPRGKDIDEQMIVDLRRMLGGRGSSRACQQRRTTARETTAMVSGGEPT
jgi:hypothetical protein